MTDDTRSQQSNVSRLTRRVRVIGLTVVALVFVYILLITVFGRLMGIISHSTSEESQTGTRIGDKYEGWELVNLVDLIGRSIDEAKRTLGTPAVDNTLAPENEGGLKVIVDQASAGTPPVGRMIVVGYCSRMELAGRNFLTLAVADPSDLSSEDRKSLISDRVQVSYRYMAAHKCDAATLGQLTPWISVRPPSLR
ncbi:MAG: hypothetical protein WBA38_14135 [Gordonia sp. (in: high G+C Gram-positive bacteria)]|uniref:hypothetical protein n=1 Tax=Gordonia sp. (in: high G+C Gram-positive bacteria) TaxID=84139 RepID=UPI003C787127